MASAYRKTYGPWYEGKTPYKHVVWFNINENMGATREEIRKMGFANENERGKDALTEKESPLANVPGSELTLRKGILFFQIHKYALLWEIRQPVSM